MGQLNQRDVINIFENNDYWEVEVYMPKGGFEILSHTVA